MLLPLLVNSRPWPSAWVIVPPWTVPPARMYDPVAALKASVSPLLSSVPSIRTSVVPLRLIVPMSAVVNAFSSSSVAPSVSSIVPWLDQSPRSRAVAAPTWIVPPAALTVVVLDAPRFVVPVVTLT